MEPNSSTHKRTSRRSHTNLSNLRLAPLSRDTSPMSGRLASLTSPHTSYIEGKSAPSTPGILGRSSSRRQLGGAGLSRKLSIYDSEYAPVHVTQQGVPLHALRPDVEDRVMPKAKSEAALLPRFGNRSQLPKLRTPTTHPNNQSNSRRPYTAQQNDDWMTRAGLATSSLLRESKGQSWLASRHSSVSLQRLPCSDDEDDDTSLASSHQRLHFADDEFSPETPRATSRWGSRFGSRVASAHTSRRGSRVSLESPVYSYTPSADYFGQDAAESLAIRPDFVDPRDMSDQDEDPEKEVARLAREASFGFGSIIDRLVGWTLFDVTEDREATDVETEDDAPTRRQDKTPTKAPSAAPSPPRLRQQSVPESANVQPRAQDEGGWQDAAWLLGVASKVLL